VFGRRRWRTPWTSGTSGTSGVVGTPTVKVVPPGVTASAGPGTAPGRAGAPGATSSRLGSPLGSTGSPESADPRGTRVIRIPASVGIGQAGDPAPASSGAEAARRRPPFALTTHEGQSVDAPPWEQPGADGRGRIAPAVIAVVIVCALLGGLAAVAATLGGETSSSPGPAASIAPAGRTAPSGRAGTGVRGAGAKHVGGGHRDSGRGRAAPRPAPTRGTARKPTAKPAAAGRAGRRADGREHHQQPDERYSTDTIDRPSAMLPAAMT
jgi:hypothetical protein